jgi:hypothetical protein
VLPATYVLEGLDINMTTQPARGWLSPNVSFKSFNIFADLPSDLIGRYDMINVQYTLTFVSDKEAPAFLQKLLHMLSK